MSKTKGFLVAVAIATMAFTFSCSSDGGDEPSSPSVGGGSSSSVDNGGKFSSSSGGGIPTPTVTTFIDDRDGKTYKKVTIGTQTWMAENLNYDATGGKCYDNSSSNCDKYGRLYNWSTARSVCPSGWHLPSDAEWTTLTDYVGNQAINAGTKLKATSGWENNGNGTDEFGFSALPGGGWYYPYDDNGFEGFDNVGDYGYWWSSTEYYSANAYYRSMDYQDKIAYWYYGGKLNLFSVRCMKNYVEIIDDSSSSSGGGGGSSPSSSSFTDSRDGQSYKTVVISNQTWMAENLNYNASGSKCYDNSSSNCDEYGRLYDWSTARNACPSGWHLPTDEEWTALTDYVGGDNGTKLKATSGWYGNGNGTDNYGFSALPGGGGLSDGSFGYAGVGCWWSSTERYSSLAYYRHMGYNYSGVGRDSNDKSNLFSVRCLQD